MDVSTGEAAFDFELTGPRPRRFTETVRFPLPEQMPSVERMAAFDRVLDLLFVAMGTSYYKAAAPSLVEFDAVRLPAATQPWVAGLFRAGLGEFAYQNDLPHVLDVDLVLDASAPPAMPLDLGTADRPPLVAVGGGKDSIVSVEVLRAAGMRPVQFRVNPNPIIEAVVRVPDLPFLAVTRRVDRTMIALNAEGAYNGHVPVTAINSLIAVALSILHGLGPAVMSNERSASIPNLTWHGRAINHQWSKGIEAEDLMRTALAAHAGVTDVYFSFLRGLSELRIAQIFASITGYDALVTSCNAAFKINNPSARWCGSCPKCQFIFLALAPYMGRERLTGIFGANLLEDMSLLPGYRQLCGLATHKPFECVGEEVECLVAVRLAAEHEAWAETSVIKALRAELSADQWPSDADVARVQACDPTANVPPRYQAALDRSC